MCRGVRHYAHIVDAVLGSSGQKRAVGGCQCDAGQSSSGVIEIQFDAGEKRDKLVGKPKIKRGSRLAQTCMLHNQPGVPSLIMGQLFCKELNLSRLYSHSSFAAQGPSTQDSPGCKRIT